MNVMSFAAAVHSFFGKKEGQSLSEFQAEIKSLSLKDRADLIEMFATVGITVTNTTQIAA